MNYKTRFYNSLLAVVTLVMMFGTGLAVAKTPLEGAWIVTSSTDGDGNTNDDPQPALYVFTTTHYSVMIALGEESRSRYEGDDLADGEKVGAYDTFIANSGRYEVDGNTLKTRAYVAKDPNYMGNWPENETIYEFCCRIFNLFPKVKKWLMDMHYDISLLRDKAKVGTKVIGISCMCQIMLAVVYFLVAKGLHQDISIPYFIIFIPMICVASAFPSIGGLGVREAGAAYLFERDEGGAGRAHHEDGHSFVGR